MTNRSEIYKRQQNFPLKVAVVYYIATVMLSIIGPIKYFNGEYKYWLVLPFMAGVCICLYFGYYVGKHTKPKTNTFNSNTYINYKEAILLRRALTVSIVSLVIEFGYVLAMGHFSFSLTSLGNLYNTRIEDNANIVILIRFLCAAFRMIANALGIYKFRESSPNIKKLIVLNVVLYILVFLFGYGNQKGVSDIVIYFAVAIYVTRMHAGKKNSKKSIRIIAVILIGALFLFSYMQYLRYKPMGINASNFHLHSSGEYYFDTNHIIFKVFGEKLGFGMASIMSGYLSQGYYGLSLCMQLPFEWSFGIGSSYALTRLLSKFGISGIYERTYLSRMTENFRRNGLRSWNTIFPWLASDYTWIGAMIFFVFVGYFLSKAWKEVIENDNIISYLVVVNVFVLILFTPANNQLFHGYDSFISTWFLIVFWLLFRGRYMHER
ncbi:hypothetical protein ABXS75_00470 [Roseburia hominis]